MENDAHKFLEFSKVNPLNRDVNKLAAYILNCYSNKTNKVFSYSQYRKMPEIIINDPSDPNFKPVLFRFDDLVKHISTKRIFEPQAFNLPIQQSLWLDASPSISLEGPVNVSDSKEPLCFLPLPLGGSFPLRPSIDRAGIAFGTCQIVIQNNIFILFKKLIENSDQALALGTMEWFNDLRMLINDCISLVDITLHQFYYKAQYDPKPTWRFDIDKLNKRDSMRINNKFQWICAITGKKLDDVSEERQTFNLLKTIRNHMSHFDPPCFAFLLQEVVRWLNGVSDIGRLLWKIRQRLEEPLNQGIIRMITLPVVEFVPKFPEDPITSKTTKVGWRSSLWSPSKKDENDSGCT